MDDSRFDAIARSLGRAASRRAIAETIGTGALAFLGSHLGIGEAAARKRRKHRKHKHSAGCPKAGCPGCQTCVDNHCVDLAPLCNKNACEEAFCDPVARTWICERNCPWYMHYCENGRCTSCPPNYVRCPDDSCDSGDCCCMPDLICGCKKGTCCKKDGTGCESC